MAAYEPGCPVIRIRFVIRPPCPFEARDPAARFGLRPRLVLVLIRFFQRHFDVRGEILAVAQLGRRLLDVLIGVSASAASLRHCSARLSARPAGGGDADCVVLNPLLQKCEQSSSLCPPYARPRTISPSRDPSRRGLVTAGVGASGCPSGTPAAFRNYVSGRGDVREAVRAGTIRMKTRASVRHPPRKPGGWPCAEPS